MENRKATIKAERLNNFVFDREFAENTFSDADFAVYSEAAAHVTFKATGGTIPKNKTHFFIYEGFVIFFDNYFAELFTLKA